MKICHLTSAHPSEDVRIFHKECRSLSDAGHEVHLVAPSDKPSEIRRHGNVFIHTVNGCASRTSRFSRVMYEVARTAYRVDADVYHFHDPELIPAGIVFRMMGKKVVYDVHEDLAKSIIDKEWIPSWQRRAVASMANIMERIGSKIFSAIVTATPAISKRFPYSKTVVVQNYPIIGEFDVNGGVPYSARENLFAYVGDISQPRGINEMVGAMEHLPPHVDARLLLVGSFGGEGPGRALTERHGWGKVDYRGVRSRVEVAALFNGSRAGMVLFHPRPNHVEAMPNKLFEYMSAGLPVIASDFPLWRDIVEASNCGILVDPANTQAIAGAIMWIIEHPEEAEAMGRRGWDAVRSKYNWNNEGQKLRELYERRLMNK